MALKEGLEYLGVILHILSQRISDESSLQMLIDQLWKGAKAGLEVEDTESSIKNWVKNRFIYQFVWLDNDDYLKALVRALWLAPRFAGTDFGTSRQRDMGQVWTDTARGFLGEMALCKFLREKFGVETRLDTRRGELEEFLPSDIAEIRLPEQDWKRPTLNISVKTGKFFSRWLDLPGAQFEHSDVFVLAKIGILRQHFLAFLKAISFLKDKLFVTARDLGELNDEEAKELWDEIPEFEPIPAYISGFICRCEINLPIDMVRARIKGRKPKRIAVSQGVGLFTPEGLRNYPEIRALGPEANLPIEIEPIIKSFTGKKFFAHSGALKWGEESWRGLISGL